MNTQILQKQTDSAGNIGYVLIDNQIFSDDAAALTYLEQLPADSYIAQVCTTDTATIIAEVP